MTKFQALFVKLLRVRYDYSWRELANAWKDRYAPKLNTEIFGQQFGRRLCQEAMITLNESWESEQIF